MPPMKTLAAALGIAFFAATAAHAADAKRIGEVSTTIRWFSPNDKVVIERFDDPKVENASCYVSRADTGGWAGAVDLAEDPSRMSIACRATGPLRITGKIEEGRKGELVFDERASFLFKSIRVSRFYDAEKKVLVYLVWSTKLIDGSPYNSITAIPLQ
jgi:CreA protein